MKYKKLRLLAAAALLAAVGAAAIFAWSRLGGAKYPEFPASKAGEPVAVAEFYPTFGWRTGDVVPVTIYVRESADAVCDTKGFAVKGDMRLRKVKATARTTGDGVRVIRFDVELQAFAWKQHWKVTPTLVYRQGGERKLLEMEELEIGTSKTFDGKKQDMHPLDPPLVDAPSYDWLAVIGVIAVALAVLVSAGWVIVRRFLAYKEPEEPSIFWVDHAEVLRDCIARMKAGEEQLGHCETVDKTVRELYGVESQPLHELQERATGFGDHFLPMTLVLQFCQDVMYARGSLKRGDLDKLGELVDEAVAVAKKVSPEQSRALLFAPALPKRRRRKSWVFWTILGAVVLTVIAGLAAAGYAAYLDSQMPVWPS